MGSFFANGEINHTFIDNSAEKDQIGRNLDIYVRIQRGGGAGGPDPPGNFKNICFLSITGPDPLKIIKLPIQHSMLGHHRPASETPFKWRFAGGPLMA